MKKFWVYIHTCPNGKKYVGVTGRNPEIRWGKNGEGYYQNEHFYRAILKYGWDNIVHEVFEVDSKEEMYRKEVELISFYHSNDPEYGYNHSIGGEKSSLGCKHSEESRKKRSEAHRGKPHPYSEETKKKIAEANRRKAKDPEFRKKQSEAHKGKTLSEETKRRIAEAMKGKLHSEETKRRIAEAKKGKPHSEEARKKMSKARKEKWSDPEYRKHMSEAHKGKPKPRIKISLPDGTIVEITKQNLTRDYINKGKKFEYVSE